MTKLIYIILIFISLNVSGANPMTTLTNNDFVKGYYGIYTSNSGYTGDIGAPGHPADNQWIGITDLRQQYKYPHTGYETVYCRNQSTYTPFFHNLAPYDLNIVLNPPSIYVCPQQIIINPTNKARKTITQDILQMPAEAGIWVKKGMNKIVKSNTQLRSDSILSVFIDSLYDQPTGLLDSVLVLREADLLNEANNVNTTLIPDDITDELDKEINHYYIAVESSGVNILNSNDIARIREIAALCPFTEGEAVYKARILATAFDPFGTVYENVCEIESNDKSSNEIQDNKIGFVKAVPNPSSGTFSLFSATLSGKARLNVYDITGRCVWIGETEINGSPFNLNLSDGIYQYSVEIYNELFTGNITIVKE